MEKRTCLSVPESLRSVNSQLCSTSSVYTASSGPAPTRPLFVFIFYTARRSQFAKAHIPLHFRLPPCIFIAPFLFISSCQAYLSSSLITPPALLHLSRPSWGAQYDGSGNALHGVCVMSHYNGSIVALSFLILVLTDHTAIFRFYKPFQRSFKGNARPSTVSWVCERERVCVCVSVCALICLSEQLISSSGICFLSKLISEKNITLFLKGRLCWDVLSFPLFFSSHIVVFVSQ